MIRSLLAVCATLPILGAMGCSQNAKPSARTLDGFAGADGGYDATLDTTPQAPDDAERRDTGLAGDGSDAPSAVDANGTEAGAETGDLTILFIGNSYTSVNDLPKQLETIAATSGQAPNIHTTAITPGGATLGDHWNNAAVKDAIAKTGWSHVVFQGQSVEPALNESQFLSFAGQLAGAAQGAGATPCFFETWARADGDAVYLESWSGGNPTAMQDKLFAAYQKAANTNSGILIPVGEAWRQVRSSWPSIVLFQSDGSHPTLAWISTGGKRANARA